MVQKSRLVARVYRVRRSCRLAHRARRPEDSCPASPRSSPTYRGARPTATEALRRPPYRLRVGLALRRLQMPDAASALPSDDPDRTLTVAEPDSLGVRHVAVVGDTYSILVSGAQTAGRYCLIDMVVPDGGG